MYGHFTEEVLASDVWLADGLLAWLDSGETPGRIARVTHRWAAPTGNLRGFAER